MNSPVDHVLRRWLDIEREPLAVEYRCGAGLPPCRQRCADFRGRRSVIKRPGYQPQMELHAGVAFLHRDQGTQPGEFRIRCTDPPPECAQPFDGIGAAEVDAKFGSLYGDFRHRFGGCDGLFGFG